MVIRGDEMQEVLRLFKAGRSKSEIAREMGKTKKWVEKALPRSIRLASPQASGGSHAA